MPRIIAEHIDQYREDNGTVKCYTVGDLIRCKDCRYCMPLLINKQPVANLCMHNKYKEAGSVSEDDYCSWAERKEE